MRVWGDKGESENDVIIISKNKSIVMMKEIWGHFRRKMVDKPRLREVRQGVLDGYLL